MLATNIFRNDDKRLAYLRFLSEAAECFGVEILVKYPCSSAGFYIGLKEKDELVRDDKLGRLVGEPSDGENLVAQESILKIGGISPEFLPEQIR